MIKRTVAIILVLIFTLTSLTACSSDTQDKLTQIQTEFTALATDLAEVTSLIVKAALSSFDFTQITADIQKVMDYIKEFSTTVLDDLGGPALDLIITKIGEMRTILAAIKTTLSAIGGITDIVDVVTASDIASIRNEISDMKSTLNEMKNQLQLLTGE